MRIPACMPFAIAPLLLVGCGSERSPAADPAPEAPARAAVEAPAQAGKSDPDRDEAELVRLEQLYARALMRKDRAFLMRFYAPDWRGGNWMGFWSKSTMLKSVLNERYVVRSMELRDLQVRIVGDVAIVQGVDTEVTSLDGKDTSGKWTFTDIFARRDGRWLAVASHTSEVKPAGD